MKLGFSWRLAVQLMIFSSPHRGKSCCSETRLTWMTFLQMRRSGGDGSSKRRCKEKWKFASAGRWASASSQPRATGSTLLAGKSGGENCGNRLISDVCLIPFNLFTGIVSAMSVLQISTSESQHPTKQTIVFVQAGEKPLACPKAHVGLLSTTTCWKPLVNLGRQMQLPDTTTPTLGRYGPDTPPPIQSSGATGVNCLLGRQTGRGTGVKENQHHCFTGGSVGGRGGGAAFKHVAVRVLQRNHQTGSWDSWEITSWQDHPGNCWEGFPAALD